MPQVPARRRSYRPANQSHAGAITVATGFGLLIGLGAALALLRVRVDLEDQSLASWLAVATPLLSAMVAAVTSAIILRWRKVGDRGSVMTALFVTALTTLSAAQFARLVDAAALGGASAAEWTSWDSWRPGFAWLGATSIVDVPANAPGLHPIADLIGRDGTWGFLAGELFLAVGLIWSIAVRAMSVPLCDSCRTWCVRERGFFRRGGHADVELVRQRAALRDWRFFRDLGPGRGSSSLRFDLTRCPTCERGHALRIVKVRPLVPDLSLVEDLRVVGDDMRTLRDMVEVDKLAVRSRPAPAPLPRAAQQKDRAVAGAGRA